MSVKKILKKIYVSIKSLDLWETNRFFIFLYPYARKISALLFFTLHIAGHIKRKIVYEIFRLNIVKRVRRKFNKKDRYKKRAEKFVLSEGWSEARKYYQFILDSKVKHPQDSELRNEARYNIAIIDRLENLSKFKRQIESYQDQKRAKSKPKIAIFTAVSNNYDTLKPLGELNPNFDYILFTDTHTHGYGIFEVKPLPFFHEHPTRRTRFIKTHPHQLLKGYDFAIWIDANIMIQGDIEPLVNKFIKSKKAIGVIPHPLRTSLDSETRACIYYEKTSKDHILEQLEHYKDVGYETSELIESNIMMFDLRNKKLPDFFATWWAEIDRYSIRDQLSLNYSLDKNKISWHKIMNKPQNARDHKLFTLTPHQLEEPLVEALSNTMDLKEIKPYNQTSFSDIKDELVASQRNRKIDVIYCVHNALEDVKICLDSVAKHRKSPNVNLIIIDDGSDKPTAEYLKKFQQKNKSWVKLDRKETGSGYTKAANRGLKQSSGNLVILLNSDTVVTDRWTEKMAHAVFSFPGAGIVGPLSSAASQQSIPNINSTKGQTATNELPAGITADDMNKYCEKWSIANFYPFVSVIHGFCFGITREVLDKLGYFDEDKFPNGYGEENDYCFRATNAGFNLVVVTNTYIYHAKSKSYSSSKRTELMQKGNEKVKELHGKERVWRAIVSMQQNPALQRIRKKALLLYEKA